MVQDSPLTDKERTKSRVKNMIEEVLNNLPESYNDDL